MYKHVTEVHVGNKIKPRRERKKWKTDRSPHWKDSREERLGEGEGGEAHVHHVYFICECARACQYPSHLIKPWLQQARTLVCRTQPFITGLEPFTAGFMGASAGPQGHHCRGGREGREKAGVGGARAEELQTEFNLLEDALPPRNCATCNKRTRCLIRAIWNGPSARRIMWLLRHRNRILPSITYTVLPIANSLMRDMKQNSKCSCCTERACKIRCPLCCRKTANYKCITPKIIWAFWKRSVFWCQGDPTGKHLTLNAKLFIGFLSVYFSAGRLKSIILASRQKEHVIQFRFFYILCH